ncbi:MAG TPA: efflux transporter outer membrane subunit [Planctomycetota bacterium]|nr:efflux transporter outer membrane subunit [Planctomycetota bacterium]
MKRLWRSATFTFLIMSGCALGPDYERPAAPSPASLAATGMVSSEGATIRFTGAKPQDRWWESFHDPQLETLVADARKENLSLRAALARVQIARSMRAESFAPLLPSINADGEYAYFKLPDNPALPLHPGSQGMLGTLSTGYEVDLWGRLRRGVEASDAEEAASICDKRAVETTVVADVAETYFELGEAEALLAIAREAVELRESSLAVVRGRVKTGLATDLDLRRAEGELATTRALVPEYERQRAVAQHRLAVLIGHTPDVAFSGKPPAAFDLPPVIPLGLPATLLERRPDVRAAEEHLRAANARIGAAIADFFPKVTIVGQIGQASLNAQNVTTHGAQLWSIGPSIDLPIFSGGLHYARMLEAEARRDEATSNYLLTILGAFREVADAIAGISAHEQERDRQREAVRAQEQSVELAENQYERGLTNYLTVLDAQRSLLAARQALVQSERVLLSDIVQLQRALGGGWTAEGKPEAVKE